MRKESIMPTNSRNRKDVGPKLLARHGPFGRGLDLDGGFSRDALITPEPIPDMGLLHATGASQPRLTSANFNCSFKCAHGAENTTEVVQCQHLRLFAR